MFDVGVAELIQGPEIDWPCNAVTLTAHYHQSFGDVQIYFKQGSYFHDQNILSQILGPASSISCYS